LHYRGRNLALQMPNIQAYKLLYIPVRQ